MGSPVLQFGWALCGDFAERERERETPPAAEERNGIFTSLLKFEQRPGECRFSTLLLQNQINRLHIEIKDRLVKIRVKWVF